MYMKYLIVLWGEIVAESGAHRSLQTHGYYSYA